ncbi:hypothetical protein, partial [Mesorhizobium sp. M2E.F.Ca.ET.154.01.1.1]|uniref:hypothetical protein n=1 Tax=Mesorhizobium sp. M2E.F.Ca.ET.154.01.1.1 TaxID=2500521 RepID=UPI0016744B8E
ETVAAGKVDALKLKELARERIDTFSWRNVADHVVQGLRGLDLRMSAPQVDLVKALRTIKQNEE